MKLYKLNVMESELMYLNLEYNGEIVAFLLGKYKSNVFQKIMYLKSLGI
ncbi:hypothetical protein [Haloplasma contractile]|nr:hypothetical protein [Haloplasma contractile]